MITKNNIIWLNGKFLPRQEAKIDIALGALHYGTAAFEGLLCIKCSKQQMILRLGDHLTRLAASARILGMQIPYSSNQIEQAIIELIRRNNYGSCYIRPVIFGSADLGRLAPKKQDAWLAIICQSINPALFFLMMKKPRKVTAIDGLEISWPEKFIQAKISGKYAFGALLAREARERGFDDALAVTPQGRVVEATSANVFMVKDGAVYIPRRTSALKGIVQDTLMLLAAGKGLSVKEKEISLEELSYADEVFLSGTASGVLSVKQVGDKKINAASGSGIAGLLRQEYIQLITGNSAGYKQLLKYF